MHLFSWYRTLNEKMPNAKKIEMPNGKRLWWQYKFNFVCPVIVRAKPANAQQIVAESAMTLKIVKGECPKVSLLSQN